MIRDEGWNGDVVIHDVSSLSRFYKTLPWQSNDLFYLYIFRSIVLIMTLLWCTYRRNILDALFTYTCIFAAYIFTGEP